MKQILMPENNSTARSNINPDLIAASLNYVRELFTSKLPDTFRFHTLEHTQEVLKSAEIIGNYYSLCNEDMNILKVSAIFHDTGYIVTYKGHEKEAVKIARKFLEQNSISESHIKKVEKSIMATKVPQKPYDLISRILCDADLINLTYNNYFEIAELMRQEWWNTGLIKMNELEFHKNSIEFFKDHSYHTEYAQRYFQPKKQEVLERLKKRKTELEKQPPYRSC